MANRRGKSGNSDRFSLGSKITVAVALKVLAPWKESYDKPKQCIKKQSPYSPYSPVCQQSPYSQSYGFSSIHIWMWELNHKEGRQPKNRCLQIVVLRKTLENPLDSKEIKPVIPKENQPWIFMGRTDAEVEDIQYFNH